MPEGPVREGVSIMGELEGWDAAWEGCEASWLRAKRNMISPFAFSVSISISCSSLGMLAWEVGSWKGASEGSRFVAAPVTRAPSAR